MCCSRARYILRYVQLSAWCAAVSAWTASSRIIESLPGSPGGQLCADQAFFPGIWLFFSRIALCSLCTIMPLRFVQVYKVFYLCEMLLTICGKVLRYRQLEIRNAPRQPEGPAEERSGGTVRSLARERRNGRRDTPDKTDQPRRDRRSGPRKRTKNKLARASDGSRRRKRHPPGRAEKEKNNDY